MEVQLTYLSLELYERAYAKFPKLATKSGCRVIPYPNEVFYRYDGKGHFAVVIDTFGFKGQPNLEAAVQSALSEVIRAMGVPQNVKADSTAGYLIANQALKPYNYELKWDWLTGFYVSHVSQLIPEKIRNPKVGVVPV